MHLYLDQMPDLTPRSRLKTRRLWKSGGLMAGQKYLRTTAQRGRGLRSASHSSPPSPFHRLWQPTRTSSTVRVGNILPLSLRVSLPLDLASSTFGRILREPLAVRSVVDSFVRIKTLIIPQGLSLLSYNLHTMADYCMAIKDKFSMYTTDFRYQTGTLQTSLLCQCGVVRVVEVAWTMKKSVWVRDTS